MTHQRWFTTRLNRRVLRVSVVVATTLSVAQPISAVTLGRPIIRNGTICTPAGVMLRGMPVAVYARDQGPYNFGINPDSLKRMRDEIHLNTIRLLCLDPRMRDDGRTPWWTPEEAIPYYDRVIANAETLGIYVIVNFHFYWPSYDGSDVWNLYHFWDLISARYKDKTWVMYEMENETSHGEPNGQMVTCYKQHMRNWAPNSPILHISPMMVPVSELANYRQYAIDCGFSWSSGKDFCAVHPYNATKGEYILELAQNGIPVIATEWGNETGGPGGGSSLDNGYGKFFEQNKIAWIDWHDWSGPQLKLETLQLIPFATSQGWAWWTTTAVSHSPIAATTPGRLSPGMKAGRVVWANGRVGRSLGLKDGQSHLSILPGSSGSLNR